MGPNSSQASSFSSPLSSRSTRIIAASQLAPVILRTIVVSFAMMQLRMNCKKESGKALKVSARAGCGRAPARYSR
ncbi:hypothetical protein CA606_00650 [Caulobacter vibrioides]|uniref:Uncharacterized protein n=1 Tax=Caulobacter vibrioides TaxID=155892 RepID=A0A290MFX2_CAUVI|nr:hypothetical protein CA606_00650 [Caulobacter vibrioides]